MTQVELPQLSLQRYVDLVRRRRWQLVPVSLLGLIIGGLIAFFIPRYFVAKTLLEHQQLPSGPADREYPFRAVVDTAKSTIPLMAGAAIDELKWPEAVALDEFTRGQLDREVEARISVSETNGGDKTRSYALISVEYRDQDGTRSAEFLNKLVQVWARERIADLRAPAEKQQVRASTNLDRARGTLADYLREKQDLERQYGFDPQMDINVQRMEWPKEVEARARRLEVLQEQRSQYAKMEAALEADREALAETQPRIAPDSSDVVSRALADPKAAQLAQLWMRAKQEYEQTYQPGTAQYYNSKKKADFILEQIKALVPQPQVDADGLVPNPDFTALMKKIAAEKKQLSGLAAQIATKEQQLEAEEQAFAVKVEGYGFYAQKLEQILEAQAAKDAALAELNSATNLLARLQRELPVRTKRPAVVPPAPTEPNILLIAFIGCVLGLGAAIGLILALDFLQGSFKTLDDVERALPVPVLGGVAYLETVAEREQSVRRRRRVALVSGSGVILMTIVVSIFYFDSTMLPPIVRDLLALILGA